MKVRKFTNDKGMNMDLVDNIMAYESGELDDEGIIKFFAELIKTGQAWTLQGSYGRMARNLIGEGYIDKKGNILWEK